MENRTREKQIKTRKERKVRVPEKPGVTGGPRFPDRETVILLYISKLW